MSDLTLKLFSGARFAGTSQLDLKDLTTNLVPYPGLHFLASCMSPISFVKEEEIPVNQRYENLKIVFPNLFLFHYNIPIDQDQFL